MSCSCHEHDCHGHSHNEQKDFKNDLIIKLIGILFFALGFLIKSYSLYMFLMAYILLGYDIIFSAVRNMLNKKFFDENFLMFVASIGAFIIGDYPEAVAIMVFYDIGEYFQDKAVEGSRGRIRSLMDLKQDSAVLLKDGAEITVRPESLKPGDIVIVRPGEKFPVDGKILSGKGYTDTSSITGESMPVLLKEGDSVVSGYINSDGIFSVESTVEYKDSTVYKIIELIENSEASKSKAENFITRFSKIYTPVVMSLALLIAVIPPLFTGLDSFSGWIYKGLTFLIVSCPCALVLSVPLSFFSAVGTCSANGVLVKGSGFISALADTGTVVFDKTGTLTKGYITVKKAVPLSCTEEELAELACAAEYNSAHPLATAVKNHFSINSDASLISDFKENPGLGTDMLYKGKRLISGNPTFIARNGISVSDKAVNETVIYIAYDGSLKGYIEFEDSLREDSARLVKALKKKKIKTVMLTGDGKASAEKVAVETGIKSFFYSLLPHQKAEKINELKKADSKALVFIGDGINDAPSLKTADIGISMGGIGSDAAIEASDVVLMTDSIYSIKTAIETAKKTRRIVYENITFILIIKAAVLLLTALGMTYMWMAVVADVGTALLAVLNTLRIRKA